MIGDEYEHDLETISKRRTGELFAQQAFTVIAVWDSTGELFTETIFAPDAHAAMAAVAEQSNDPNDLQVVCAIAGEHSVTAPCEDSNKTAQAPDLADNAFLNRLAEAKVRVAAREAAKTAPPVAPAAVAPGDDDPGD